MIALWRLLTAGMKYEERAEKQTNSADNDLQGLKKK